MDRVIKLIFFFVAGTAIVVTFGNYYFGDFLSPQGGIYLSMDKGDSWRRFGEASGGTLARVDVIKVEYNPKDERIMYLGSLGSGIFKSVDGGSKWTKLEDKNTVLSPRANVYSIAADYTLPDYSKKIPDRFYLATYQENYGRIFKTDDGGASFKEVYTASRDKTPIFTVQVDPRKPSIVWAGTGEGLLLKSQDYGETWKIVQEFPGAINSVIINPRNPNQIFVATYKNGVFTSFDGGASWMDESVGLKKYSRTRSVETAIRDPYTGNIYLGTSFGVLKSSDGGINWNPLEIVFPNDALPVLDIAFSGKNNKEIYVSAKNYIYSTEDGGNFWKVRKLGASRPVRSIIVDPKNNSRIFAGLGKYAR